MFSPKNCCHRKTTAMDLTREALTSPEAGVMLAGEDGAGGCPCPQRADRPHRSGGPRTSVSLSNSGVAGMLLWARTRHELGDMHFYQPDLNDSGRSKGAARSERRNKPLSCR